LAGCGAGPSVGVMNTMVNPSVKVARALAEILIGELGDRWAHTNGVAQRAEELSVTVASAEREVLIVAAWLHDIGYGAGLRVTGFHPLDGATYLHHHGWPDRVCALVAHHSGARFVARALGLDQALNRHPYEQSSVSDALTMADQTTGPHGQRMSLDERMAEMLIRHGDDSVHAQIHHLREPQLRAAAERVQRRLSERGAAPLL
jgi:putative nucleotidyltransferase with HDIG domain